MPENTGASYPKFSPDGKQIAFIGEDMCATCHSRNYLSVMDSVGSNMREIAEGGYSLEFTWTADNQIILARGDNHTSTSFFQIDPRQNSEPKFLAQIPLYANGWNIVVSNNGTILFTGLDYNYNSQLYSLDLANTNMKPIQGTDGLFLVGLSYDEQTIFATDDSRSNSFTLYAIDVKNTTSKAQLSYGYFDYAIHENIDSSIHVAYAYGPGGVALSDKEQMSKMGVYVGTHVIPEFPTALLILTISLVTMVFLARINLNQN